MLNYITRKKPIYILLLLCIVSVSFTAIYKISDKGIFAEEVTLKSGESVLLENTFPWVEFLPLIQDESHDLENSAVIKAFETNDFNFSHIDYYINRIQKGRRLGYWNLLDSKNNLYNDYYSETNTITAPIYAGINRYGGFPDYYRSLFQNKTCRKLMFNSALDIVENLCRNYPSDFLRRVNYQLDELIELTKVSKYYNTNFSYKDSYFKGFVYRRVETDNVPLSEIHNYLIEAKRRLSKIDKTTLDEALYEIKINGDIQVLLNSNGYFLIQDYKKLNYTFETPIKSIKYLEDNSGGYYLIEGHNFRDLYDDELNPVK